MYGKIFGPSSVQLHNLNLVLKQIKLRGPVSRADIARGLDCSKSTVTKILGQLIGFRLVREVGKGSPATGRKSTLLEFNPNSYFVVAVDLRPGHFQLALADLSGSIECQHELRAEELGPAKLIPNLVRGIRALIKKSKIDPKRIQAAGIMVSGITDTLRGVVRYSAVLGWNEAVELAPAVAGAIDLPVFIENDVNALGLAESWIGCGQASDSLAYLYLDEKVGGGYINGGYISQGVDFAFAEFGKLVVGGDRGPEQLEMRLDLAGLQRRFGPAGAKSGAELPGGSTGFDRLLDGDSRKKAELFDHLAGTLGQVITTIVAILNPHLIVLHCFSDMEEDFIKRLERESRRLLPKLPERTVRLVPAMLHGRREIIGAVAVAISNTRFKFVVQG